MRHWFSVVTLLAIATLIGQSALAADAAGQKKIRILLTVGGHDFEQKQFYEMFDKLPGMTYKKIDLPQQLEMLKPGLEKDFDVIVMYDLCPVGITPEQQKNFVALLQTGIGLVAWHHNMAAHDAWPEYHKIIGGRFFLKPTEMDGQKHEQSGWDHDQDIPVAIADKQHPITKGLKDFQIHDEVYNKYWTDPKVKVLLTTNHPKNDPELAWVHQYGKARVFYLMLGHDSKAWQNPSFHEIFVRGIRWAAAK
jgi:type 1 glutamine amidotransferase